MIFSDYFSQETSEIKESAWLTFKSLSISYFRYLSITRHILTKTLWAMKTNVIRLKKVKNDKTKYYVVPSYFLEISYPVIGSLSLSAPYHLSFHFPKTWTKTTRVSHPGYEPDHHFHFGCQAHSLGFISVLSLEITDISCCTAVFKIIKP